MFLYTQLAMPLFQREIMTGQQVSRDASGIYELTL